MYNQLPVIYVVRHGDTAWTVTGQHTGLTDLPLTPEGERQACGLRGRLKDTAFTTVLTSPLRRAQETCALAGFGSVAEIENDLVEWDYGKYEGLRSAEIHAQRPDWELFRDGAPGGETPAQVAQRADNIRTRVSSAEGNVLLFSSGHFIRVLAARWIGLEPSSHCNSFLLGTASLSVFSYEHDLSHPVIQLWNETHHVSDGALDHGESRA
jgi:broad specificity phosphatase PhoE